MSKTYYIFRHGETFATLKNRGYGLKIISASILESAKPVINKMALFLKNIPTDYNATSPYRRCLQTTQIITDITGKQFVIDKRLSEFFLETFGRLRNRVQNFINQMESSDHQTILICTHGAVMTAFISLLSKDEFRARDLSDYPRPGILIKISNGQIEEYDFND